jgi:protein-S-isoprenylcysteine O-methyltransferase Ste14
MNSCPGKSGLCLAFHELPTFGLMDKKIVHFFEEGYRFFIILISISGYVPKHATIPRTVVMSFSLVFSFYLANDQPLNSKLAITYFILSTSCYIGFVFLVLPRDGWRHWFIRRWGGEDKGYLSYEAILGFLFFHNAVSIGYIASSTPGALFCFVHEKALLGIAAILFIGGFTVKIWAAKAVSVDIYYWKDMFLGRKISDFIFTGPYRYFNNPMYGVGQMQAYAVAIWAGSIYGLIAAFLNQCCLFSFYYLLEKKFITRVYQNFKADTVC